MPQLTTKLYWFYMCVVIAANVIPVITKRPSRISSRLLLPIKYYTKNHNPMSTALQWNGIKIFRNNNFKKEYQCKIKNSQYLLLSKMLTNCTPHEDLPVQYYADKGSTALQKVPIYPPKENLEISVSNMNAEWSSHGGESSPPKLSRPFSNLTLNMLSNLRSLFTIAGGKAFETKTTDPLFEDTYLNIKQLANKYKYDLEAYNVKTEDGFILRVHRIPRGRNSTKRNVVVFLMHGVLESSDSWLVAGPGRAAAYELAEAGYDVWLGNARGNKHSNRHERLRPSQRAYWAGSWDHVGLYDLPAMIDLVLRLTREKTVYYVGHSQGTTSFFAMMSLRPEYAKKVTMMFALAPVAFMSNARSPLVRVFAPKLRVMDEWLVNMDVRSSALYFLNQILQMTCYMFNSCNVILNLIIGMNYDYIKDYLLPVIYGHMPTDTSTMQFVHYGQLYESGRFCRFDYGEIDNFQFYGRKTPPDYNLSTIALPVVLYYSANDWFSHPKDVHLLISKLPNVYNEIFITNFNHIDFLYAHEAVNFIYKHIIELINEYENYLWVLSRT